MSFMYIIFLLRIFVINIYIYSELLIDNNFIQVDIQL